MRNLEGLDILPNSQNIVVPIKAYMKEHLGGYIEGGKDW